MIPVEVHEFDVFGAVSLTAASAWVVLLLVLALSRTEAGRLGSGLVLAGWFAIIVGLSTTPVFDGIRGLGTYAIGAAVGLPTIVFACLLAFAPALRPAMAQVVLPLLIALHAARIFGAEFLLLWDMGRLGSPFAPVAGWGDIIIGLAAFPIAAAVKWRLPGWRPLAWTFTLFGTIDLVVAVSLGIASAPDSPIRFFYTQTTPTLTALPWLLIPAFLVPSFLIGHIAAWRVLRSQALTNGTHRSTT